MSYYSVYLAPLKMTIVEINKTAKNVPKNNVLRISPISFHSSCFSSIEAFITTRLERWRKISAILDVIGLLSLETAEVSPEPFSILFQEEWGERCRQMCCGLSGSGTPCFPGKSF